MEFRALTDNNVSMSSVSSYDSSHFDDQYKIKITSKKLHSGRCQVKFYASIADRKQLYGYVLVNAEETLKKVMERIRMRLDRMNTSDSFHHINLYSIGKKDADDLNFIIFDA
ncbi:hypothetical protein [uncultured Imperialibacter sp.]|uniref:hypothetical protein n=1 Tax=uncultured Imperialibacter sp. TaxID=1672639 RepID=UPI0030D90EFB|tara:strand:- start:1625 stop:1960 length:336 start_codon:yes stop_codon:yes gene_type:complete